MNNPYFIGLGIAQIVCGSITIATQVSNFFTSYLLFYIADRQWPQRRKAFSLTIKSQIKEQICLEKHFQYEFSILGRFGQPGLQREKKIQAAISMQRTFDASFFM